MKNFRKYGKSPIRGAIIHGGSGAAVKWLRLHGNWHLITEFWSRSKLTAKSHGYAGA